MTNVLKIYTRLLSIYGPQGWWPLTPDGEIETRHHCGTPKTERQRFEIIAGAILTQNTSWKNVEKAIKNLNKENLLDANKIIKSKKIARLIRPAGYYNQKAERLKIAANFFNANKNPLREQLLEVNGIGPETADSILLYAYDKPFFVIDTYTKRIFQRLGFKADKYEGWQRLIMDNLPKDTKIFKEYHALLVELGKNHCKTKPICNGCPIREFCNTC